MKQIEKREVEVTYCDWCHKEVINDIHTIKEKGSGLILHFHDKCLERYKELKSKEVK